KVWLVRDRLGIKPLYYFIDDDRLVFASEIKGILALLDHRPACDAPLLHEWLYYGNALGSRTLYRGIRRLPAGCFLEIDLTSFANRIDAYWSLADHASSHVAVSVEE